LATDYAPSLQGFNQTLEGVTLPSSLESLTLGYHFNQSLQGVVFPEHLESLSFGHLYNQSLEGVRFPESLQTLKFGDSFQHSLKDAGLMLSPRMILTRSSNVFHSFSHSQKRKPKHQMIR
jgi:hypothetical protein